MPELLLQHAVETLQVLAMVRPVCIPQVVLQRWQPCRFTQNGEVTATGIPALCGTDMQSPTNSACGAGGCT